MAGALLTGAPAHAAPQNNGVGSQFELLFWQSVAGSDDPGQLEAYLAQYPTGTFAALARAKIAMLTKRPLSQPAPAPVAVPVPTPAPVPVVAPPPVAPEPPLPVAPQPVAPPEPAAYALPQPLPAPLPQAPVALPSAAPDPVAIIMGTAALPAPITPAPAQPSVALPPRPQFQPLPPVDLPARFCTAMDRNDFYDVAFRPSKDVADHNNQTAINHMRTLQSVYDRLGQGGDMAAQNIVAAEARAYQPVAAGAYQASMAYDGLFNRLMAVPIVPCGVPAP